MNIPEGLPAVEVVVYGGSGGPNKNSIPVRNDFAQHGSDIGYVKNGEHFLILDQAKISPAVAKEYFNSGWAVIWRLVGLQLYPGAKLNCVEQIGHLKVVKEVPFPTEDGEELVLILKKVEYIDGNQVFTWRKPQG